MNDTGSFGRFRPRHAVVLIAVVAAAVVGGVVLPRTAEAKGIAHLNSCALQAIRTDQNGVIDRIDYKMLGSNRSIKGCGAKITNLPHLVEALQLNRTIDMVEENDCLKAVQVNKP